MPRGYAIALDRGSTSSVPTEESSIIITMHRVVLIINLGHNFFSTNLSRWHKARTAPKNVAAVFNVTIKLIVIFMVLA